MYDHVCLSMGREEEKREGISFLIQLLTCLVPGLVLGGWMDGWQCIQRAKIRTPSPALCWGFFPNGSIDLLMDCMMVGVFLSWRSKSSGLFTGGKWWFCTYIVNTFFFWSQWFVLYRWERSVSCLVCAVDQQLRWEWMDKSIHWKANLGICLMRELGKFYITLWIPTLVWYQHLLTS